jgi:hypothetical protein
VEKMNITSAQYSIDLDGNTTSIITTIDGVTMHVPLSQTNRHYAEIMRQVEAGELVIQEAESGE